MLRKLLNVILLEDRVGINDIERAMDNKERIIIRYKTKGEDAHVDARVVEVYAYGLTRAGRPVIRCFQPYGDTTTKVPRWKFFRLDRIVSWEPTGQVFNEPADKRYPGIGTFNHNGDKTMSVVYKVADFSENDAYRTDAERRLRNLKQQVDHPITLDDLINHKTPSAGAAQDASTSPAPSPATPEIYRTDTERGMENLLDQLNNPKKIDLATGKPASATQDAALDNQNIRTLRDLNNALRNAKQPEIYRTDTERGMENLLNQLNNPKKIDLSRIPKR